MGDPIQKQSYPHLFELVCGTTERPIGGLARDELSELMKAVHTAGVEQGRREAAEVCDSYQLPEWERFGDEDGMCPRSHRLSDPTLVADDCAAAIRALPAPGGEPAGKSSGGEPEGPE